jgi:hypothetical protein
MSIHWQEIRPIGEQINVAIPSHNSKTLVAVYNVVEISMTQESRMIDHLLRVNKISDVSIA